jgi:hypothetical protein
MNKLLIASLLFSLIFLPSTFLTGQEYLPLDNCCSLIWSSGSNLGWATALSSTTQIRERWDSTDDVLLLLMDNAAINVTSANSVCSEPYWDDYLGKANWIRGLIKKFRSNPNSTTRKYISNALNGTYNWGDQLARQIYYYQGLREETFLPTCAEKYFKLAFSLSAATQYFRHAREAANYGNENNFNVSINNAKEWLKLSQVTLSEYYSVRTGTCVPLPIQDIYNRLDKLLGTYVYQNQIQYFIDEMNSVWEYIYDQIKANCGTNQQPEPEQDDDYTDEFSGFILDDDEEDIEPQNEDENYAEPDSDVAVEFAESMNFVGTYEATWVSGTPYARYHATIDLYGNGKMTQKEFHRYYEDEEFEVTIRKGTWEYSPGNNTLTFNYTSPTSSVHGGKVRGKTSNFVIEKTYRNSLPEMRLIRK